MLGYWLLLQLIGGALSRGDGGGVAFWAHVGGFAAGSLLIFLFRKRALVERHPQHGWRRPTAARRQWDRGSRAWS
jgi:membrane associated rhomboid family serine protease